MGTQGAAKAKISSLVSHFTPRTGFPQTHALDAPAWHYVVAPSTAAGVGTCGLSDRGLGSFKGSPLPKTKRNLEHEDTNSQRAEAELTVAGFTTCCFVFVVLVMA